MNSSEHESQLGMDTPNTRYFCHACQNTVNIIRTVMTTNNTTMASSSNAASEQMGGSQEEVNLACANCQSDFIEVLSDDPDNHQQLDEQQQQRTESVFEEASTDDQSAATQSQIPPILNQVLGGRFPTLINLLRAAANNSTVQPQSDEQQEVGGEEEADLGDQPHTQARRSHRSRPPSNSASSNVTNTSSSASAAIDDATQSHMNMRRQRSQSHTRRTEYHFVPTGTVTITASTHPDGSNTRALPPMIAHALRPLMTQHTQQQGQPFLQVSGVNSPAELMSSLFSNDQINNMMHSNLFLPLISGGASSSTASDPRNYVFSQRGLDNIITSIMENLENPGPPPANQDQLDMLQPTRPTQTELNNQSECSICMTAFTKDKECYRLPCQHLFDTECIMEWLTRHGTCPICRKDLSGIDTSNNLYEEGGSTSSAAGAAANQAGNFPEMDSYEEAPPDTNNYREEPPE